MKKIPKTNRNQAHTSKSPKGMGDFYGTGIRAKYATIHENFMAPQELAKNLKKPPRSLA